MRQDMNRSLILCMFFLASAAVLISCSKELSFEVNNDVAKGTLHDAAGNCFLPSIHGTYKKGVSTGDSNYVAIQVNVTTAGNYTITTDNVNGFIFSNAGSFNTTGIQTINLKASGKPLAATATTFTLNFDTTACSFTVNVNDSLVTPSVNDLDSAWMFTEGTRRYKGYIDTAYTKDTIAFNQTFRILQMQGSTAATGDSVFLMSITFAGGAVTPGTYTTNTSTFFRFIGSYRYSDSLYSASPITPAVTTTVTISAYNASTRILQGTFSGTAKNKSGTTVNITSGKIQAKLN